MFGWLRKKPAPEAKAAAGTLGAAAPAAKPGKTPQQAAEAVRTRQQMLADIKRMRVEKAGMIGQLDQRSQARLEMVAMNFARMIERKMGAKPAKRLGDRMTPQQIEKLLRR